MNGDVRQSGSQPGRDPDFLVVGAQKAGTSTYVALIEQHPEIYVYPHETFFFNRQTLEACREDLDQYRTLFAPGADRKAVGEKCGAYCNDPAVPAKIRACLPDVKLIWLFREPIARSYSGYWHAVLRGQERRGFSRAIREEPMDARGDDLQNYARRSAYVYQVKRYLQHFGKEQMLFLLYEEMAHQPQIFLERTWKFLGVDPGYRVPDPHKKRNPTRRAPRSILLYWLFFRIAGPKSRLFELQHKLNAYRRVPYPPMQRDTRAFLEDYFKPRNRELAEITELDLSAWTGAGG